MRYETKLALRLGIGILLLLIPFDLFYILLLKPTLELSAILLAKYSPTIIGDSIQVGGALLKFIPACIASTAYLLLAVLILTTYNIPWKKRISMFIIGSAVIFIGNLVRIYYLAYLLLEKGQQTFYDQHLFIWTTLSTIFVAVLWIVLIWLYKIKHVPVYSDFKKLIQNLKSQESPK